MEVRFGRKVPETLYIKVFLASLIYSGFLEKCFYFFHNETTLTAKF